MAKFLHAPVITAVHLRTLSSMLLLKPTPLHLPPPLLLHSPPPPPHSPFYRRRSFCSKAIVEEGKVGNDEGNGVLAASEEGKVGNGDEKYPSGEFEFEKYGAWKSLVVKFRMLFAYPWERVKKGSVLSIKLRGQISDQLKSRFSSGLSLPQLCENFIKAAYDPRISGIYIHIDRLDCGWGKVEEIRRHILDFKKSGKFVVGYTSASGEKEYYIGCACDELYSPPSAYFALYGLAVQASFLGGVLEKVGIEPQVQRIGKYKSAGDQLIRKSISEENREMLTTLLDNIYKNFIDNVSNRKGNKTPFKFDEV